MALSEARDEVDASGVVVGDASFLHSGRSAHVSRLCPSSHQRDHADALLVGRVGGPKQPSAVPMRIATRVGAATFREAATSQTARALRPTTLVRGRRCRSRCLALPSSAMCIE